MEIPHIIKYMGSKRSIIDFVTETIIEIKNDDNQRLYDVFGGSGVVAGSFRNIMNVTCNDIQHYTRVLAGTYLNNYFWENYPENIEDEIIKDATKHVNKFKKKYGHLTFPYKENMSFDEVVKLEQNQRDLMTYDFEGIDHLFVKNFSGTYWSFEQCLWIDAISSVARSRKYKDSFVYNVILSSLMFSMAYCTQSTGHYAQYRELTEDNLKDILMYRNKNIVNLFKQKFISLKEYYNGENNHTFQHNLTSLDFLKLLDEIEPNSIVYADPPYQFVHYSRFYHALETLVKYDYPKLEHKGRYRDDRHQSPFCIRTKVKGAFKSMFERVYNHHSTIILSYSDNGMISLDDLVKLSNEIFINYNIEVRSLDYIHSTMGRKDDKSRNVQEILLICSPN